MSVPAPSAPSTPSSSTPSSSIPDVRSSRYTDLRPEDLAERVKFLMHESAVRRIIVKNDTGHTVMEIPVVVGLVAAVIAPVLTAVGALGALAGRWQIEVHRHDLPSTASSTRP